MDKTIAQEILHELFSALEALETQTAALLQFVKGKGLATEQDLAPYLEQAGNASNVRWRAARVRIDHLLTSAVKAADRDAKAKIPKSGEKEYSEKSAAVARSGRSKEVNENDSSQTQDSQQTEKDAARAKLAAPKVAAAETNSDLRGNQQQDNKGETGEKENENIKADRASRNMKEHAA